MTVANDANILCQPRELKVLQDLANVNDKLKELETQKQDLVSKTKSIMKSYNVTSLQFDGHDYTLIGYDRRNVPKASKNEFVSKLIAAGKKHLIRTSIELDMDGIFAEVDAGLMDKNFVDEYVKVVPISTLRVT